jgi:ribonuclease J
MTPTESDLWFLPLGGCGEIGMNLNLYAHNNCWLMVDCGVTFANPGEAGPHVQMADPQFVSARREQLCALLVTHAHEDHVGAVAHLWPQLKCPVYCTSFTAAILRRKLAEAGLLGEVPIHIVQPGSRTQYGAFDVEWVGLTHSTPQSQGLVIRTPLGNIFHSGDWKLDAQPVVGPSFDADQLAAFGRENILALVCDSTNAQVPGHSTSEGVLYRGLYDLVAAQKGRVIVGCFGSNIARLHTLATVARDTGRYAGLIGRSLLNYYAAAREAGVWDTTLNFIESQHLGYLPRHEVLAVATGSQGEPRTALRRLAADNHPDLNLDPGDMLLMSSRVIPGNEDAVAVLTDRLEGRGVRVVGDEVLNMPIHASGHPAQDELRQMYSWVKPQIVIPVHGEPVHMAANAKLAKSAGVTRQMLGANGDLFMLAPQPGVRRGFAAVGRLGLSNNRLVAVSAD